MAEETYIENNPDAARTIDGLRDTGYDFNSACADIIDNSNLFVMVLYLKDFMLRQQQSFPLSL